MRDRLAWIALSAIPAGLVIAVTSYMTTDVAAAPFLWVLPLALYLLTFVGVFRERPWIRPHDGGNAGAVHGRAAGDRAARPRPRLLGGDDRRSIWSRSSCSRLLCHGEVYRRRPAPARLTEFYLFVSLGGVVGGIFAALIAPHIFSRIYEYPILIAAAVLALPGVWTGGMRRVY